MTHDYRTEKKVKIKMSDFVADILKEFLEDSKSTATTPAANHVFTVNKSSEKLEDLRSQVFHAFTANLLFLCKRALPNIQTTVAFLMTRVIAPDVDDCKKLVRLINYLRLTPKLHLTLESSNGSGIF